MDETAKLGEADEVTLIAEMRELRKQWRRLLELEPGIDPDNAWHTLLMLRRTPLERLEWSLMRGRGLRANRL